MNTRGQHGAIMLKRHCPASPVLFHSLSPGWNDSLALSGQRPNSELWGQPQSCCVLDKSSLVSCFPMNTGGRDEEGAQVQSTFVMV